MKLKLQQLSPLYSNELNRNVLMLLPTRKEKYAAVISKNFVLDRLPGLDFAGHCNTPIDESHKTLFSCPVIERGIRECQRNGKKVLIALGGPRGSAGFDGEAQAEKFAENIWNLFLGGQELPDLRPFSRFFSLSSLVIGL